MFRTVTRHLSYLDGVIASVRQLGDMVSKSYERQVSAILQAGETFSASWLTFFQVTVARLMQHRSDVLQDAERVHRAALRKLTRSRNRRDSARGVLRDTLLRVRTTVDGAHGRGTADLFIGLEAEILTASFRVLVRIAREAVDVLSQPDLVLPDTALRSTVLTPLEYAEQIRPVLLELEAALEEVEDQKRVTEEAQKVRTKALEASRKTNVYGSRLLEALFVLAGEEFHAARLRPKVSQLASPDDDAVGPGPPDGEGGEADDGEEDDGEADDGEPSDDEPSDDEPALEEGESPDPSS